MMTNPRASDGLVNLINAAATAIRWAEARRRPSDDWGPIDALQQAMIAAINAHEC
jgi:hypothetical protein